MVDFKSLFLLVACERLSDYLSETHCDIPVIFTFYFVDFSHCVKSVQIQSYFWSAYSCIRTEYRKISTRNNSLNVFRHFSRSVNVAFNDSVSTDYFVRFLVSLKDNIASISNVLANMNIFLK